MLLVTPLNGARVATVGVEVTMSGGDTIRDNKGIVATSGIGDKVLIYLATSSVFIFFCIQGNHEK